MSVHTEKPISSSADDSEPASRGGSAVIRSRRDVLGRPAGSDLAAMIVAGLPELILCVTLAVAVVTEIGLLLRSFHGGLTVLLGLVIGIPVGLLVVARGRHSRDDVIGSVGMLVLSAPLTLPNYALASQWLSVERDPGFYTVTAKWLTLHASPVIDGAVGAFGRLAPQLPSAGFNPENGSWEPQSSHLVPALVSLPGRFGDQRLLGAGALIGAVALLALYAASRRLVGPFWALLPPLVLGVSVPFLTFTRGIYTEPLTLVFAFTALALLVSAVRTRSRLLFLVAGTAAGAASMTRIDGLIVSAPLVGGLALLIALTGRTDYRVWWTRFACFAGPAVVGAIMGTVELAVNSTQYFADMASEFRSLVLVAVATILGSFVLALVARARWWNRVVARPPGRLPLVVGVLVVVACVVLALRPLFWVGHYNISESAYGDVIRSLQAQVGQAPDGSRSYDEESMRWMSWYIGIPALVLAVVGLGYLAARSVSKRRASSVLLCLLVGCSSALYLNRVAITPEQIWAARRFLPVIIPGFLIAATVVLHRLARFNGIRAVMAGLLAAVAVVAPLRSTLTLYSVPEASGWLAPVRTVCGGVDGGRVLVGGVRPYLNLAVTIRAWCEVPIAALVDGTDVAAVEKVDPRPLYILTSTPQKLSDGSMSPAFTTFTVVQYEDSLLNLPQRARSTPMRLYLTRVNDSGQTTAVTTAP